MQKQAYEKVVTGGRIDHFSNIPPVTVNFELWHCF